MFYEGKPHLYLVMPTEPTVICCKCASLTIPSTYGVKEHDHLHETIQFAKSMGAETLPFDWDTIAAIGHTFEITMQSYTLTFNVSESDDSPREYLKAFANTMTRQPVDDDELVDCNLGQFDAVRLGGDYSDTFTSVLWCAKLNDLLVHIGLQGPSIPTQGMKDDVDRILASLTTAPLSA